MTALLVVPGGQGLVHAGIPEPDLVWYGQVLNTSGPEAVRLTQGQLAWRIEPLAGGSAITVRAELANINDQFSFIVRVPLETPEPGNGPNPATLNLLSPAAGYRRVTVTLDGQPLFLAGAPAEFSLPPSSRGKVERIDLRSTAAPVDSDGDGIADEWEFRFFGAAGADPAGDEDDDGLNNLREFRAGTDPKDAGSVLEFVEVSTVSGRTVVKWASQDGKRYRLRRSARLSDRAADFAVLQSGIAGAPPVNEFTDTTAGPGALFFYLVEVEP